MERTPLSLVRPSATIIPINHISDARAYELAVEEQQRGRAISPETARPLATDFFAERLQAVEADTERDLRANVWSGRVTAFCVGVLYLVVFLAAFQIGRALP